MITKPNAQSFLRHGPRRHAALLTVGFVTLAMSGCAHMLPRNSTQHLPPVDRDTLPSVAEQVAKQSAMLADVKDALQEQISQAPEPAALPPVQPHYDPLENKVVSIRMYDASVSSLLWAMADQLGMNLILGPGVQQMQRRATLSLTNVTAREVFDNILQAFDLHGEVHGRTLFVTRMQEKVYTLGFLGTRMDVQISDGGNVFGANGGSQGGSGGMGGGAGGGGGNSLRSNFTVSGGLASKKTIYKQIDEALQRVLGERRDAASAESDQADARRHARRGPTYTLNESTGVLYVRARPSRIRSIDKIVTNLKKVLGRQVQIDVQLIDVKLSDAFRFGVDWTLMREYVAGVIGPAPLTLGPATRVLPAIADGVRIPGRTLTLPSKQIGNTPGRSIGVGYVNDGLGVAVNMLRHFGEISVLSNPSVRVRNGAPAVLSVGTNIRYLASSSSRIATPGGGASIVSSNVETDSLFSGLMIGVVPFIREDGTVELLVHPVQSQVDPSSLQLVNAGGGTRVTLPRTSFKSMTTTLQVRDGATVMIGGLIDQTVSSSHDGVPGLAEIPLVGRLFDQSADSHSARELVMVMRVNVL